MSFWFSGSKQNLIKIVPMAYSLSVALPILLKICFIYFFLLLTGCKWCWRFCGYHIFPYDQQGVSHIAHCERQSHQNLFLWPISLWVTLDILWKAVSPLFLMTNRKWATLKMLGVWSYLSPWQTGSKWHCKRQSDYAFSYDQQAVSDIWHVVKGNFQYYIFFMTNSLWVSLHCTFCEGQSNHFFYAQQGVSDIVYSIKGSLIIHYILWPIAGEWYCTFHETVPLITSFPIKRKWVTLHLLWNTVSSYISYHQQGVSDIAFLQGGVSSHHHPSSTASEWHGTSCEMQSHHIVSCDQQFVSNFKWKAGSSHFSSDQQGVRDIRNFMNCSLITSFPMITVCEWQCICCERQSHHIFPMTKSLLVTLIV